jgi:hypothetical protein
MRQSEQAFSKLQCEYKGEPIEPRGEDLKRLMEEDRLE